MDFLTAFPYWFIIVLVIANAVLVRFKDIEVTNPDEK